MKVWSSTIKGKDICKRCHRIHQHWLVQSGFGEDSRCQVCPVCGTLHSIDGKIYKSKITGKDVMINKCAKCGSDQITRSLFANQYYCRDCSRWYTA